MGCYLDELLMMSCSWMIEVAKEELQILEAQHPSRFSFLKNEIETFINISAEESDKQQEEEQQLQNSSSAYVSTQASSNNRMNKRKTSADAAIERAEACLRKIRKLKQSLIN